MKTVNIRTNKKNEMIDITREIQEYVKESGIVSGVAHIFVPHTTTSVTISENTDPDVLRDVLFALERAVPNSGFAHMEGNSDAHTKAQMMGFSLTVIIEEGQLVLGTWQSVFFCEFDGPRKRKILLKIINSVD